MAIDSKTLVAFASMVTLTVAGNIMLKLGALVPSADRIFFGLLGWKSVTGLVLFGCSGLLYAVLLRYVPLNLAQSFTALQFVGVIIAAFLILGEPISVARWIGIGCIIFGILLVGATSYS